MATSGRIPSTIKEFDEYITSTDEDQTATVAPPVTVPPTPAVATWQRLGLTSQNSIDWHAKRTAWDTPITGLHAVYVNPATSTSIIKQQVVQFISDFRKFAGPLLDTMAASANATVRDEKMYNFITKAHRKKPTKATGDITVQCFASITAKGGGMMAFSCRLSKDTKRASLAPGTGMVEVLLKAGGEVPTGFTDVTLTIKESFTKASFVVELGAASGKLQGFVRWADAHNKKRVGPWTAIAATGI